MDITKQMQHDPFHAGEQQLQEKYGSRATLSQHGHRIIHTELTQEHQLFFQSLSYVAFASVDESGRLRSTLLCAETGFITVMSPDKLILQLPEHEIQLVSHLQTGDQIALLGIDFSNRRRNRVNGWISLLEHSCLHIEVKQAFGNCPKYIQQRSLSDICDTTQGNIHAPLQRLNQLSAKMQSIINKADTSFIASHYPCKTSKSDRDCGADISHRGGYPGFINVIDAKTLMIPDYSGNRFFNTLGNIIANPAVSLLIVDFENGHLLQLSGQFQINHGPVEKHWPQGAERLLEFSLEEAELRQNVLPTHWQLENYSPFLELSHSND
ncbi:MAG: pyridoxamine 5'-phosphate oxidase family protein [Gammaproteobacteria bacterium]|nr:pyridoxamine 5'-phosphate oxidase family protein [Gammaproteobacteria bacterium]